MNDLYELQFGTGHSMAKREPWWLVSVDFVELRGTALSSCTVYHNLGIIYLENITFYLHDAVSMPFMSSMLCPVRLAIP